MIKSSSSGRHYEFHCLITDETGELIFGKKHYHSIWPGASKVMTSFAVTYAAKISREYTVTTAIPKLHRSNLIEMKKNKTVSWFEQLPSIVQLAIQRRSIVAKQYKEEEVSRDVRKWPKRNVSVMLKERERRKTERD